MVIEVEADLEMPIALASVTDELDCLTEEIQLSGEGSSTGAEFNYEWFGAGLVDGIFGLNPTVNAAGDYELLVTNTLNGCTETAFVSVTEDTNFPTDIDILISAPPCFGDLGSIEISSVDGGTQPYLYSLDGGINFFNSSLFEQQESGTYDVIVQDANGCEYQETIIIPITPELTLFLENEITIELGEGQQLNAITNISEAQIDTIIWSPSDALTCTNCLNPIATPLNEILYTVTLIDENGCEVTDQIKLKVNKNRNVYIPNAFSPNGDGNNDIFMIFAKDDEIAQVNSFQVFDRWGELVYSEFDFQPNQPVHSWDGNFLGQPMSPAVFVYWAEIRFIDGRTILYKGDVTLVR